MIEVSETNFFSRQTRYFSILNYPLFQKRAELVSVVFYLLSRIVGPFSVGEIFKKCFGPQGFNRVCIQSKKFQKRFIAGYEDISQVIGKRY